MRPKLLSINNYYYYRGGAETVFLEQNRMFESLGWEVASFAMHHPKNLTTPWSRYFVEEIELGQAYSLSEKIIRAGKVIYSSEAPRRLGCLIDDVHPDVAHAHNMYHHISPSISVCSSSVAFRREALSYGLPVLASNIPANLEVGLYASCYFQMGM